MSQLLYFWFQKCVVAMYFQIITVLRVFLAIYKVEAQ